VVERGTQIKHRKMGEDDAGKVRVTRSLALTAAGPGFRV